ncbi:uncharacterized protein METZ01_LOCUS153966, partial [marine metagenome]
MRSSSAMRTALAVLIVLLFAPFGGVVTGSAEQPVNLGIEGNEILPTYSRAVQLAFERVGDMGSYSEQDLVGVNEWLVVTRVPLDKHQWTKAAPVSSEPAPILRGAYIWNFEYPIESIPLLQQSLELGEIESFSPLVEKQQRARLTPDDTEFDEQWHLENTGQTNGLSGEDVNVTSTWDTYTGSGVVISVVDDGLDHSHSDLSPHYSSQFSYDWCDDDGDPSPSSNWNGHGTAVAGVAAAVGDNTLDVTGVAFNATIAGSTLIACSTGDSMEAEALSHMNEDIDIYTNSWGPADDGQTLEAPGPLTLAAFESDAYSGRDGLGNLITWAAGNGLGSNDDSNYDGYANSRFTIAVTAINHNGEQSNYAEPGANILVAAHSNGDGEGITTTDITGSGGYSNGNVTHTFGGTSSATPLAAGVIALVLDANENLTWRDVQHVLVNSARMNDASDSSWVVNGAGHDVSHKYGFGVVDAGAAVAVAESWVNVDEEFNSTYGPYTLATDIPDGNTSWSEYTTVVTDEYSLESVDLVVDITHAYRGDLDIVLVSPSGTESWLAESRSDNGNDYSDWMFSTVRHWDESSLGTWTLKVRDSSTGDNGTLNSWELILHGVDADYDHDNDGLSDENETLLYGTDPYDADSDDDGLSDYDEVIVYGTNPLAIDSDTDGLTDYAEVMNTGTDPLDSDTDDDGLSDGAELNYWSSDPLVYDPDDDSDLFYHFNDCNDTNPNVNPGKPELLNGIDDNCDDYIDEGYNFTDLDNDGLKDWIEYHVHGTD